MAMLSLKELTPAVNTAADTYLVGRISISNEIGTEDNAYSVRMNGNVTERPDGALLVDCVDLKA
jgi:hypothetical protein